MYILKKYHNKNIGTAMFDKLVTKLKQNRLKSMYVWVLRDNSSVKFYKAMGGLYGKKVQVKFLDKKLFEDLYYWENI